MAKADAYECDFCGHVFTGKAGVGIHLTSNVYRRVTIESAAKHLCNSCIVGLKGLFNVDFAGDQP